MAEKISVKTATDVKREVDFKQEISTTETVIEVSGIPAPSTGKKWVGLVSIRLHEEDIT